MNVLSSTSWAERLMPDKKGRVQWTRIALIAFFGVLLFFAVSSAKRFATDENYLGDFVHFYEASRAVWNGTDLYDSGTRGYIYPPLFAIVTAPMALLSRQTAGAMWTCVNFAMIAATVAMLAREAMIRFGFGRSGEKSTSGESVNESSFENPRGFGFSGLFSKPTYFATLVAMTCAMGLLLNVDKVRAVLSLGQTDALVLLLLSVALCVQRRVPIVTGICLGLAFNIKYQAVIFLPYLLLRRRWAEAGAMIVSASAGLLSGALVFGWERNSQYLLRAFAGLLEMAGAKPVAGDSADIHSITWERSVSLVSAMARLAEKVGHSIVTPAGVVAIAAVVVAIGWLILAKNGSSLLLARGGSREVRENAAVAMLEWAGLITGVLVFSPQTTNRHMYLLTFATVIAAAVLLLTKHSKSRAILMAGIAIFWLGLTMPPGKQFPEALTAWRAIGGASWCVLVMYFTLLYAGLQLIMQTRNRSDNVRAA
ncbi:MAG: glycosyltransferase family 87 protein [Phycisphaerales bacterium]